MLARRLARTARLAPVAALAALTLGGVSVAQAQPQMQTHQDASPTTTRSTPTIPTAAASAAGITAPGEAFLGWSAGRQSTPRASSRADALAAATQTPGIDVSSHQGNVNWTYWWGQGKRFAYVKATEGTTYKNPYFAQQYNGSYTIGMIRGAYHFGLPNSSSGATQANWFASNGGGWSADGKTLPGVLDIEYNPYGASCYGKTQSAMRTWIADFLATYKSRTGRDAIIYTTTDWWTTCTGNTSQFAATNPLWIARYSSSPGTLPAGWSYYTIWQYTSSPLDQDYFNGDITRVRAMALG